jgi:hypothetical protein
MKNTGLILDVQESLIHTIIDLQLRVLRNGDTNSKKALKTFTHHLKHIKFFINLTNNNK